MGQRAFPGLFVSEGKTLSRGSSTKLSHHNHDDALREEWFFFIHENGPRSVVLWEEGMNIAKGGGAAEASERQPVSI